MEGFWPIFFLAVILKIPVGALLYLVWWAIKQTPETEEAPPEAEDRDLLHWRREPEGRATRAAARTPGRPAAPACPPGGARASHPPARPRGDVARARGDRGARARLSARLESEHLGEPHERPPARP